MVKDRLYPPLPVYDAKKDGNQFQWIIETAERERQKRAEIPSRRQNIDYLTGKAVAQTCKK